MRNEPMKPTNNQKRALRFTLTTLLVVTVILAIAAVTVVSKQQTKRTGVGETKKLTKIGSKNPNMVTVKVAGQDVQVNSQTGQILELTQEEAQRLAAGLKRLVNQSTEGLVQTQHSNGLVSVDLQGRFQNVTVARVNKDRSVSQSCVDNPRAAAKFFGIDPQLIEGESKAKPVTNRKSPKGIEGNK